jgi:hypothetical protein
MPQTTAQFPFEFKLMEWAARLTRNMTGENRGFLILLYPDGSVQEIVFANGPRHFDFKKHQNFAGPRRRWILYHPYDAPRHTWMEWRNVPLPTVERLMSTRFNQTDFVGKNRVIEFPVSWMVMF